MMIGAAVGESVRAVADAAKATPTAAAVRITSPNRDLSRVICTPSSRD
jgi:hypothetical protein